MFLYFQPRTVRFLKKKWYGSGIVTSSLWMSHGGGVDARSNPVIVSNTTFEYRRPVSGPSCRSSDCRKYLHPRSEGVPTQDVTLSVSNQSVVSSDLSHKSTKVQKEIEETHKTASGLRLSRRHCLVRCENRSVKSTSRVRAAARAKLNRLFWTNRKMTDSGERRVASRDIQGQFLARVRVKLCGAHHLSATTPGPFSQGLPARSAGCIPRLYPKV